ncbi:BZ3500_MvSof-1268-A1-R1_Chr3-3g06602 [Microbotryum saponariae]|uniref:BZ3500_MvSof-1268-A1-R1_Chr3-3g06602 protein n=1 Tax=Microbotryum saponariae TaxID=289078 RepID=A0A2X0KVB9_9BASI|nr:BZ3500_MvSof-1268-A1-R1_Chr3-3g06602 [Microbotryum saponariae]
MKSSSRNRALFFPLKSLHFVRGKTGRFGVGLLRSCEPTVAMWSCIIAFVIVVSIDTMVFVMLDGSTVTFAAGLLVEVVGSAGALLLTRSALKQPVHQATHNHDQNHNAELKLASPSSHDRLSRSVLVDLDGMVDLGSASAASELAESAVGIRLSSMAGHPDEGGRQVIAPHSVWHLVEGLANINQFVVCKRPGGPTASMSMSLKACSLWTKFNHETSQIAICSKSMHWIGLNWRMAICDVP